MQALQLRKPPREIVDQKRLELVGEFNFDPVLDEQLVRTRSKGDGGQTARNKGSIDAGALVGEGTISGLALLGHPVQAPSEASSTAWNGMRRGSAGRSRIGQWD